MNYLFDYEIDEMLRYLYYELSLLLRRLMRWLPLWTGTRTGKFPTQNSGSAANMIYTHKLYLFLNSTYPSLHSLTDDLIECCTNLLHFKVYFCLVYNVNFSNLLSRDILFIRLCWELYLWSWTKYHIYQRYQRKSYFLCSWKATAASIYRATNNWVF